VTAPITSEALLSVADTLAHLDDPTTAARRRAVSTAYYALFHGLIGAAVRHTIGEDPARDEDHAISTARAAVARLGHLAHQRTYGNYCALLLGGPKLAGR
jgi:hypothetical protein